MAMNDVFAELPGESLKSTQADSFTVKAIAEQAVFLSRNYENVKEGKVVTSESIDGISVGYTLLQNSENYGIFYRAQYYINRQKKSSGGTVRYSRG